MAGQDRVMTDWRSGVDDWWAEALHLPVDAVHGGGVFALDHVDHVGVVVGPGDGPLLYGPSATLPALHAATRLTTGPPARPVSRGLARAAGRAGARTSLARV
jgi:hypothetical protein